MAKSEKILGYVGRHQSTLEELPGASVVTLRRLSPWPQFVVGAFGLLMTALMTLVGLAGSVAAMLSGPWLARLLMPSLFVALPLLIFRIILKELRELQCFGTLPYVLTVYNGQLLIDRLHLPNDEPIALDCELIEWIRVDEIRRGQQWQLTIKYSVINPIKLRFIETDSDFASRLGIVLTDAVREQPAAARIVADDLAQH